MIVILCTIPELRTLCASLVMDATKEANVLPERISIYAEGDVVRIEKWRGKPVWLFVQRCLQTDEARQRTYEDQHLFGFPLPQFPIGRPPAVQPGCETFKHKWGGQFFERLSDMGIQAWAYSQHDKIPLEHDLP